MKSKIAYGVDLGWVSQLESMGICWIDSDKNATDPIAEAKRLGADAVRLRVFVNPPEEAFWIKPDGTKCMLGFCDADSVLKMCQRVKALDMKIMIDFHYSDHFADPLYQHIPEAWISADEEELARLVAEHTTAVLKLLTSHGIFPEWVQVGNEINPGLLLPVGNMKDAPERLVRFLNAGYGAVKECCPECKVITHVAAVLVVDIAEQFYDTFFRLGGRTDILGLSYYPYWYGMLRKDNENIPMSDLSPQRLKKEINRLADLYEKPIMIVEIGGPESEVEATYQLLSDTIDVLKEYAKEHDCESGIFYWEPEAVAQLLPDRYPLGAAKSIDDHTLQYTKVLSAYQDSK